jgi:hypothetical protein
MQRIAELEAINFGVPKNPAPSKAKTKPCSTNGNARWHNRCLKAFLAEIARSKYFERAILFAL